VVRGVSRCDLLVDRAVHPLATGHDLQHFSAASGCWAGHRRRGIARAREVVRDLLAGDNVYDSTPAAVERWFMAYAVQARARR
jgi:hypothetical protein